MNRIFKYIAFAASVLSAASCATAPYNLTIGEIVSRDGSSSGASLNPESSTLTYLVDPQGEITFPILGRIKVEGMTRSQLVDYLSAEIGKDVKDPIVYVAIKNYKITVLGEVGHPGTFNVDSDWRMTSTVSPRATSIRLSSFPGFSRLECIRKSRRGSGNPVSQS
ncbi:MAG: polysaccharide biosynthesis/export family protein [Bacteroidales bacterium]|nr:polysaccharide biosynthesis/export family protein [Bacteroidales bacterium]